MIIMASLSLLVLFAVSASQAAPAQDLVVSEKEKEFTTDAKAVQLKSGATGSSTLSIVAAKGWKWNKEYPAKVTFAGSPKHVTLAKAQFKQFGGDFKTSEKRADIAVSMTGKAAGKETLKASRRKLVN